jgi:hypothetical protein
MHTQLGRDLTHQWLLMIVGAEGPVELKPSVEGRRSDLKMRIRPAHVADDFVVDAIP